MDDNKDDNNNDNADHDVCRPGQVACQASSEENRPGRSPLPSCAPEFHLLQIIIGIMIFSIVIVVVTKFVHNLTTALLRPGVSSSTLLVSLSLLSSSKVVTCKLLSSSSIFLLLLSCALEFHLFHLQVIFGTTAKYIFGDIYIKCNTKTGLLV